MLRPANRSLMTTEARRRWLANVGLGEPCGLQPAECVCDMPAGARAKVGSWHGARYLAFRLAETGCLRFAPRDNHAYSNSRASGRSRGGQPLNKK